MKNIPKHFPLLGAILLLGILAVGLIAYADTPPSLGLANTFSILAGTYTNTVPGTSLSGDLGYTTGPAVAPTVGGSTHVADGVYGQAGIDQGTALTYLNSQSCTHTFPAGAVDLAANVDFPTATYTPGVYCVLGAATIGTGGILLSGAGTYIFRSTGAFDTVASSAVTTQGGASACTVWWTPGAATTLGANSHFLGNVIDDAGITIGSTVAWLGKALAFGGTVTTDTDTFTTPVCTSSTATLTLTKIVINDGGNTKVVSDFPLFIGGVSMTSGVASTTLAPGTYTVSEATSSDYTAGAWTGDCSANGSITLVGGDVKACTITNNDIDPTPSPSGSSGGSSRGRAATSTIVANVASSTIATSTNIVSTSSSPIVTAASAIPFLPNTGFAPKTNALLYAAALALAFLLPLAGILSLFYFLRKKRSA